MGYLRSLIILLGGEEPREVGRFLESIVVAVVSGGDELNEYWQVLDMAVRT